VIEHLNDPTSFLRNCHGLLKPGGKMVIATPTRFGEKARDLLARLGLVQRAVEGERVHGHVNIFTRESISRLLEECGFRVIRAGYFQLWMNMLLVGVKDGAGEAGGAP
jgi:2-polyprenyl-3-methyl-5-hydroxy-6-metoxy-1,4-benzoquinol methylase